MSNPITVTQLNTYIKRRMSEDTKLQHLSVRGEISNFKRHSSGHLYFGIKDEESFVSCVMFKGLASKLKFRPENGTEVIISGHIDVYTRSGAYQLYAESMEAAGLGDLYLAFNQMKEKLSREGLFAGEHKKDIPLLSPSIGVVTSPTGAVWHDIQNVSQSRFPGIRLTLYPAAVQGDAAVGEIVKGIEWFNRHKTVDLIIVGRGGGSLEDLWAFNTEPVARAVFGSELPVISAVGHETDVTITDFVADRRAATPSHAAEMAVPSLAELKSRMSRLDTGLVTALRNSLELRRNRLSGLKNSFVFTDPARLTENYRHRLEISAAGLENAVSGQAKQKRHAYELMAQRLSSVSPLETLGRGYALAIKEDNDNKNKVLLKDAGQTAPGDTVTVLLNKGYLNCSVLKAVEEDFYGK